MKSELTRENSDSSNSALTADNANARPGGPSTVWTDEMHRLYLNSLEASFIVNQLHNSLRLRGCLQELGWRSYSSQHQFTALQDCSQQKKRNEPLLESTADSQFNEESPHSIHNFTSLGDQWNAATHDLQGHKTSCHLGIHVRQNEIISCGSARSSEQDPACCHCHQNFAGSTLEGSDQNFVNKNEGEEPSCVHVTKRLRTDVVDASSNDRVVPLSKADTGDVLTVSQASSKREEQVHQEILSENPDSFVRQNSALFRKRREG